MMSNNKFNGYYLEYNISNLLFNQIKKTIGKDVFYVFNKDKKELMATPNSYNVIPIGIFSNKGFKLECDWEITDRTFKVEMEHENKSIITLTDVQKKIIQTFLEEYNDVQTNNLCPVYLNLIGECSIGKTVISIEIISRFKFKTLVITPSIDLAKQWGDSIKKFLINSDYHVSTLGATKLLQQLKHVPDILLVPSKHLANKSFIKYIMKNYTICFIDEQHMYNLETNETMKKFFAFNSFPSVISLTATPRRINTLYLGREINLEKIIQSMKPVLFKKELYEIVIPKYDLIKYSENYFKYLEINKKKYLNKDGVLFKSLIKKKCISEDQNRHKAIVKNILLTYNETDDAKIIVLVHFVSEIDFIYQLLKKKNIIVYKIFASSKNNEETSLTFVKEDIKNKTKYILIGTEDHLGTGIDVKELNILHLVNMPSNENNIIQYAGRVSRDNPTPIHKIFYYNISSYPRINLEDNSKNIIKILKKKDWEHIKKMLF